MICITFLSVSFENETLFCVVRGLIDFSVLSSTDRTSRKISPGEIKPVNFGQFLRNPWENKRHQCMWPNLYKSCVVYFLGIICKRFDICTYWLPSHESLCLVKLTPTRPVMFLLKSPWRLAEIRYYTVYGARWRFLPVFIKFQLETLLTNIKVNYIPLIRYFRCEA